MPELEVKDLQVEFSTTAGKVQAVRGVSFTLQAGRTLALVGESGSGKSVTGRAILGLLPGNAAARGQILYDGKNILSLSDAQMCPIRGKRIAMIFQDPMSSLNPIMRVGRQITEVIPLSRRQANEQFHAVGLILRLVRGAVAVQFAAFGTAMNDDISLACIGFDTDRLHFTATFAGSIAWVDIYVKRPQAKGTVVARGVAQGMHLLAAMRADKPIIVFGKSLLLHVRSP